MRKLYVPIFLTLALLVSACAGQQDKWTQRLDWAATGIAVAKGALKVYDAAKPCGPENPSKLCRDAQAVEEATKAIESAELAVKLGRDVVANIYSDKSDRDKAVAAAIDASATLLAIGAKYGIF
ncbi:MAG: hypothetical protein AB7U76_24320 [Pirellulales bacterium]